MYVCIYIYVFHIYFTYIYVFLFLFLSLSLALSPAMCPGMATYSCTSSGFNWVLLFAVAHYITSFCPLSRVTFSLSLIL